MFTNQLGNRVEVWLIKNVNTRAQGLLNNWHIGRRRRRTRLDSPVSGVDLLRGGHICGTLAVRNLAKDYNK
jgi:hypothetical protein